MRSLILTVLVLSQTPEPQTPTVEKRMGDHFSKATEMKAAIVSGKLAEAKAAAAWLGKTEWSPQMSEDWRVPLQKLRAIATRTSIAPDLPTAAMGLGEIGAACAECHRALGGPQVSDSRPPGPASGAQPRMTRHGWAVERMWLGLTTPSDPAWLAGTEALADAPLEPKALGQKADAELKPLANRIRALGERAHAAPPMERATIYGQLLSTCASCHTQSGAAPRAQSSQR